MPPAVAGACEPQFEQVRHAFERNFVEHDELGASVCVIHNGRTVVDLWGGYADARRTQPWHRDTVVVVFSCTKGATALCAHILASAGDLDLDAPVKRYWPEFGQAGKDTITVRMLLNHQAGLPGLSRKVDPALLCDFDAMSTLLESESPLWEPGTRAGYHSLTFGWLVGQVVRRVTGVSVGAFLRSEIARPLGLDFAIGIEAADEPRVAETVIPRTIDSWYGPDFAAAASRGEPIQRAVINAAGLFLDPGGCDAPGFHAAEIPAANGISNARGLAALYSPLAHRRGDNLLVSDTQVAEMAAVESASLRDAVGLEPSRYTCGFQKTSLARSGLRGSDGLILSEPAFGHAGMGGSLGFADPSVALAFGYAMNRHHRPDERPSSRPQSLVNATYRALGYVSADSGRWISSTLT